MRFNLTNQCPRPILYIFNIFEVLDAKVMEFLNSFKYLLKYCMTKLWMDEMDTTDVQFVANLVLLLSSCS